MVAQFLRLKLTLLGNTFRRNPWRVAGMVILLAYALGLTILATVGLVTLRSWTPDVARPVVIVFGSLVVLGFLLLPLVFGADDPLDPRRFTLFGLTTPRIAIDLAVAALVSVPTVVVAVFSIAQIVTWSRDGGTTLLAVLAALIIVPTCVLGARVSTLVASLWLGARRVREAAGVTLLALFAILGTLLAVLASLDWESHGLPIIRRIAAVVTWTPLGAAWSIPADAATGRGEAGAKIAIALVFLLALAAAWYLLVARAVAAPTRTPVARRYSGLGWFGRLPATPGGVIAARSLSYWGRDARYRVALAVVPVVPVLMIAALWIGGVPLAIVAWIPVPVMALFLGWSIHNDVALDSTAFWEHVSASTSGTSDRFGRTVPVLFVGIPLVLVGGVVTSLVLGDWSTLPAIIGLSACVLLVGLGISSVVSAAFPYPAVLPGDSPFAQPQAAGNTGAVVQAASFFLTALSAAPAVYFVWLGATDSPSWYWLACGYGLVVGALFFVIGVRWGGWIVSRRGPELLAFTLQN